MKKPHILLLIFLGLSLLVGIFYLNKPTSNTIPQDLASINTKLEPYNKEKIYSEEEIQNKLAALDPLSYHVLAENGTETPFKNTYWDNKKPGIYVDKVTGEPLFSSTHKFVSGTGWPSFWRTIEGASITEHQDRTLGMVRTEVRSQGGHLGHLFLDGPPEHDHIRYCINSAALNFVPLEKMAELDYEDYLYLFE